MNIEREKHPAYGMVKFNRVSGNPGNLFGASVSGDTFVTLEISPGEKTNTGNGIHRSYMDTGEFPYIQVAMSNAQFAELLTSMNIGSGVPCTIKRIRDQKIEDIPDEMHIHKLDQEREDFKTRMKGKAESIKHKIKRVDELLGLPRLNREQKDELRAILRDELTEFNSNIPFYMNRFQKTTDEIVSEAKAELDATVQNSVMQTGINVLGLPRSIQKTLMDEADEQYPDDGLEADDILKPRQSLQDRMKEYQEKREDILRQQKEINHDL